MKKAKILLILCLSMTVALAQQKYEVSINLTDVKDDQLEVICKVPKLDVGEVEFQIPKIVPGTYSIYDFGRFLNSFQALDSDGGQLETDSISPNRILIKGAQNLAQISYWVEDTYDTELDNVIFEPAGTNIEDSLNFVINTFGFVGYLTGYKELPYEVRITHPDYMYGATALEKSTRNDTVDVFSAPNYFDLADGPILYCKPDTTTFELGGAEVLISVYSPNGVLNSAFVKEQIIPTLNAQQAYLDGELPVDRYAFLIHLKNGRSLSGGFGALEHSYSSLFNLPEMNPMFLAQAIRDVAAHEFFHIVTPLNIHSEEIGDFDFIEPKMSKHLWMYEGVTEYAAGLAQVKYGEMPLSEYLNVLQKKITESRKFNDTLPFTVMSSLCLGEHKKQYYNVYQKGALIGMALDIQLRELSGGDYGVQELMRDLAKQFGKEKSFKDEELFDTIVSLTYPQISDFFDQYVSGEVPIPYQEFMDKVGIVFTPGSKGHELSLGHISFGVNNEDNRLVINSIDAMNSFGKSMGYEEGDIIYKFDGVEIDIENYETEFRGFKERHKEGDKIKAIVFRADAEGKKKKVKLSAKALSVPSNSPDKLEPNPNASDEQRALRKAWVNK